MDAINPLTRRPVIKTFDRRILQQLGGSSPVLATVSQIENGLQFTLGCPAVNGHGNYDENILNTEGALFPIIGENGEICRGGTEKNTATLQLHEKISALEEENRSLRRSRETHLSGIVFIERIIRAFLHDIVNILYVGDAKASFIEEGVNKERQYTEIIRKKVREGLEVIEGEKGDTLSVARTLNQMTEALFEEIESDTSGMLEHLHGILLVAYN